MWLLATIELKKNWNLKFSESESKSAKCPLSLFEKKNEIA